MLRRQIKEQKRDKNAYVWAANGNFQKAGEREQTERKIEKPS